MPPGSKVKDTYQVVRKIAGGGMGEVYLVRHLQLDISYALKLMLTQWVREPKQVARFQDEARLMARIHHPNVARVFDSGELNGHPYLIMEWLEGETLYDRAERSGRLPLSEVVDICWGVAAALQVVHDQGIVHRDIKPGNVFLCPAEDGSYQVKVLDFGIARIPRRQDVTLPGTVLGTPEYMAPEQARGDNQAIGPCTDQYALALVAYRLLSGQTAFSCGDNIPALLYRIQIMDPPPLPADVPATMQEVIRRAMSKNPLARYESVRAFAEALDEAANPPPAEPARLRPPELSQTIPPSPPPSTTPPPGRWRFVTTSAAAIVTAFLLLLTLKRATPAPAAPRSVDAATVVPPDLMVPMMHWQLDSTPAGAAVYDAAARLLLGHTPWAKMVPAGTEPLKVELQLAGYQPANLVLSPAQDEVKMVTLLPVLRHWQVLSEPPGALIIDEATGMELGRTPWKFSPEQGDRAVRQLRLELPRRASVGLSLDPQRDEYKRVTLHLLPAVPQAQKLTVLCVDSTSLAARNAAVIALHQAGCTTLRAGESLLIKRDGPTLVIAQSNVASLDEVKQRIVESALRELLRGQSLPEQLVVKCAR